MSDMARHKKMLSLAIDPEAMKILEDWLAEQEFPPTKTAVVEVAIKEFVARRRAAAKQKK